MDTVTNKLTWFNRLADVRTQAMPYGVQLLPTGMYQVFNRDYKPLGAPFLFERKRKEFTPQSQRDAVFFYNDATNPARSARNMERYLNKIRRFMVSNVRMHT